MWLWYKWSVRLPEEQEDAVRFREATPIIFKKDNMENLGFVVMIGMAFVFLVLNVIDYLE